MLILSRNPGENIMVGDDICITILSTVGNNVRVGVTAPKDTPVDREEIYLRKKQEANEKLRNSDIA